MFRYEDFESSGNPILIENESPDLPLPIINGMSIYGRSTQKVFKGVQLFNPFDQTIVKDGLTITKNKDASHISVDGTATASGYIELSKPFKMKASTSYILKIDSTHQFENIYVKIFNKDQSHVGNYLWIGKNATITSVTTLPDTITSDMNCIVCASYKRGMSCRCGINHIRLFEGNKDYGWEPYTGGINAPSLALASEIVNNGNDNSLNIHITNKNLLKGRLYYTNYSTGIALVETDEQVSLPFSPIHETKGIGYVVECTSGTQYTLSVTNPNKNWWLGIAEYPDLEAAHNHINSIGYVQLGHSNSVKYTARYDGVLVCAIAGAWTDGKSNLHTCTESELLQLEYGSNATTYEPPSNNCQTINMLTPNGLPGLLVSTGGNYTDKNGQQYICDEIDLGRGKYVQRVAEKDVLESQKNWPGTGLWGNVDGGSTLAFISYIDGSNGEQKWGDVNNVGMCNYFVRKNGVYNNSEIGFSISGYIAFRVPRTLLPDWDESSPSSNSWINWLRKKKEEGNPVKIQYALAIPIERDLTPEEIAAYSNLQTYNDTTVISNDSNCHMKINYTKGVIMPKYDSTKLIVQMKALARTESMPIDSTEVWDSLAEAQSYVKEANAYAGQTIKALVNGKYKTYTLQPSGGGYTLEEVGAVSQSDLKQYVQVVERLPESGQQQGVIYIVGTTGQIWTGSAWKVVFKEVSAQVDQLTSKVTKLEGDLAKKAPINNPVFTGKVMVGSDEVAVKSYVDGLISNLVSSAPGVVDGDHPLPVDGYKAGQTWRVALAGTYAGQKCEVGDLIICIKDFNTQTNNSDFMVVQANVDGAVTSTATTSTVGEIVVFNAATGKVIKGSGVNISSLNDVISKAHTHANKTILDSYDKDQTQLLADAAATAQSKVDALKTEVNKKANKATTLVGYGITDAYTEAEIDAKLKTITDNVNTKVDAATVDSKIDTAKGEIETAYNKAITEKLAARVGSIPEDTDIKTYVDTAIGSGGTASAEAIAKAKQEAINASKQYTDSQLQVTEF